LFQEKEGQERVKERIKAKAEEDENLENTEEINKYNLIILYNDVF
jgi:hypothetical protein